MSQYTNRIPVLSWAPTFRNTHLSPGYWGTLYLVKGWNHDRPLQLHFPIPPCLSCCCNRELWWKSWVGLTLQPHQPSFCHANQVGMIIQVFPFTDLAFSSGTFSRWVLLSNSLNLWTAWEQPVPSCPSLLQAAEADYPYHIFSFTIQRKHIQNIWMFMCTKINEMCMHPPPTDF